MLTGGEILIECLKAQGVRCVFGMPGTQNIHIYDALLRRGTDAIRHYLVRHEQAATYMADGFARTTGEVGVALTVPGPGASNAATGILEAFTDCSPVLLITGQSLSRHYGRDPSKMFHGLDQMRFFGPVTRYCAIARQAGEIPGLVEKAFQAMRGGRPGPAVLEFPEDAIRGQAEVRIPARVERPEPAPPDEPALREAASLLGRAETPLIFAGSAVVHAGARDALRHLAEKLGAPVVVTRLAKGALPDQHPQALQYATGFMAREALKHADCTLAVGVRFTSLDTRDWHLKLPRPLIQLDEDPGEIGREYPCEAGVVGGLEPTLRALAARSDRKPSWGGILAALRSRFAAQSPLPLLGEIRELLPESGILAVDVHTLGYATFDEFPVADPHTFLYPAIGLALGHAFPAALGAQIGRPESRVICFSGDGGFLMGTAELATAVKYGLNVVTVVVNDGALTSIRGAQQKAFDGRTLGTSLRNPDFAALAQAFGAYGVRVKELGGFKAALRQALEAGRPALVEVCMQERQAELVASIGWLRSNPLRDV